MSPFDFLRASPDPPDPSSADHLPLSVPAVATVSSTPPFGLGLSPGPGPALLLRGSCRSRFAEVRVRELWLGSSRTGCYGSGRAVGRGLGLSFRPHGWGPRSGSPPQPLCGRGGGTDARDSTPLYHPLSSYMPYQRLGRPPGKTRSKGRGSMSRQGIDFRLCSLFFPVTLRRWSRRSLTIASPAAAAGGRRYRGRRGRCGPGPPPTRPRTRTTPRPLSVVRGPGRARPRRPSAPPRRDDNDGLLLVQSAHKVRRQKKRKTD